MSQLPDHIRTVMGIEYYTFFGYAVSIVLLWGYVIALWLKTISMQSKIK